MNLLKKNTGHDLSVCYGSYSHGYCIIILNEGTPPLSSLPSLSYYHNQLSIAEMTRDQQQDVCIFPFKADTNTTVAHLHLSAASYEKT